MHPRRPLVAHWVFTILLLTVALVGVACSNEGGHDHGDDAVDGEVSTNASAQESTSTASSFEGLEISDARVSVNAPTGAIYLRVKDGTGDGDRLLAVETSLASQAETHETSNVDGVMQMRHLPEGFEVPPGGELLLEPGGRHIMLMEAQSPEEGTSTVPVTLVFEKAGRVEVEASLQDPMAGMDHHGHGG